MQAPPIQVQVTPPPPRRKVLRSVSKWIAIGWSGFCLFGVVSGFFNVAASHGDNPYASDAASAGMIIGIFLGLFIWLIVWAVIALPALVVWTVAKK